MPVQFVNVIIVGVSEAISKKYYLGGYVDGESKAPDCFSVSGISPDPASAHKQSVYCATCPQNIWGSTTTEAGKKAKACRDGRRIAVVPAGDPANETFGGAMLLDIPPTSLNNLERYASQLSGKADLNQVVTRLSFNPSVTHQELLFEAVDWVADPAEYAIVEEIMKSDTITRMLEASVEEVTSEPTSALAGARPAHLRPSPLTVVKNEVEDKPAEPDEPVQQPPTPPTPTLPPAAAQTAAKPPSPFSKRPVAVPPVAAAAAPAAAATKPPAAPTVVQGAPASLEAEIDNLLANG
jgi:hypothetical protein